MNTIQLLAGAGALLMGRRLYWLFVGVMGFQGGLLLAQRFMTGQSEMVVLVLAIATGVLSALVGATMILQMLRLSPANESLLFVLMLVVGIGSQSRLLWKQDGRRKQRWVEDSRAWREVRH